MSVLSASRMKLHERVASKHGDEEGHLSKATRGFGSRVKARGGHHIGISYFNTCLVTDRDLDLNWCRV